MVRVVSALLLSLSVSGSTPLDIGRHPIHSTLTEISYDPAVRLATVRVRAFADDFATAIARWDRAHHRPPGTKSVPPDSLSLEYLTQMISLENTSTGFATLEWCGVQQTGAVLWFCLRGRIERGLEGVRVADRLMNDLFADEINIVQMEEGARHTSAVFTRRDAAKVLIAKAGQ